MKKQDSKDEEDDFIIERFKMPIDEGGCGETDSINFISISHEKGKSKIPIHKKKNFTIEDMLKQYDDSIKISKSSVLKSNGKIIKPQSKIEVLDVSQLEFQIKEEDSNLYPQIDQSDLISQIQNNKSQQIRVTVKGSIMQKQFFVRLNMFVSDFKNIISKDFNMDVNQIRLNFLKQSMVDDKQLFQYNVQNNSIIFLTIKVNNACFQQNTQILTTLSGEQRKISQFQIGDQIVSYNFEQKKLQMDKISFVSRINAKQMHHIKLSNGIILKCTADHKFLTPSGWKKIQQQFQEKSLRLARGDFICSFDGQQHQILQISFCKLQIPLQLYHLSIQKNHTFLAQKFICHNMQIIIKCPDQKTFQMDINPSSLVQQIAKRIQKQKGIKKQAQKIVFAGKQLDHYKTLADLNITKGSTISFFQKKTQATRSGLKKSSCATSIIDEQQIELNQLTENDSVLAYNPSTKKAQYSRVIRIESFPLKKMDPYTSISFHMQKNTLQYSGQIYLMHNNEYFFRKYNEKDSEDQQSKKTIKNIEGQPKNCRFNLLQKVTKDGEKFYRIYLKDNLPIVINSFPVEFQVQVQLKVDDTVKLKLKVLPSILVKQLKNQIAQKLKQKKQFIHLFRGEQVFKDEDLLGLYLPPEQICTIEMAIGKQIPEHLKVLKKRIKVKNQTQIIEYEYSFIKNQTVPQLVKNVCGEKAAPYFCFIYGQFILKPNENVSALQNLDDFHKNDQILLILLKTSQRMLFYHMIKAYQFTRQTVDSTGNKPKQKLSNINESNAGIQFIMDRFKNAKQNIKINNFIKKSVGIDLQKTEQYGMVRQTVQVFYKMANYMSPIKSEQNKEMTHSIIKIQTFKNCNGQRKVGDSFYWRSFVSTQIHTKEIVLPKDNYTIYHIRSLTGKKLKGPQNQVVFMPFTYFYFDKIISSNKKEEVWLTQICAPYTFKKNILLWVDDIPSNNTRYVKEILAKDKNLEYLPILSTCIAQIWMKQFAWLMNWRSVKIKVISDMSRIQGENSVFNNKAGIDLVHMFNNQFGYTTPILIFCMDRDGAIKSLQQRKINNKQKYCSVGTKSDQVYDFINFEK